VAPSTEALAQSPADVDPTRTVTLRDRYAARLRGRFGAINTEIRAGVRDRDVFGLQNSGEALASPLPSRFPERQDRQIETFDAWLQRQMDAEVLTAISSDENQFVRSGYEAGLRHADTAARADGVDVPDGDVFATIERPIHRDELQLAYTRDYSELEGITQAVSQQSTRTLAEGLAAGEGPRDIARRLTDRVDAIGKTRATALARTSVIDTFNSAALARYEELGIDGVTVQAEWKTAGDNRVCDICQSLEGRTWSIEEARSETVDVAGHSDIPVKPPAHPRCRCAIIPSRGT
jgi:SPP1 gp7 family putative phage head morphogenesis protein